MSDPNGQPWLPLCSPWAEASDLRAGDSEFGCAPCAAATDAVSDEIIDAQILAASEYLHATSRFQFGGICSTVARPCPSDESWWGTFAWAPIPWFFPAGVFPPWWGVGGCGCGLGTGQCCGPAAVAVGHMPIVAVTEVKIDGVVLPADEYRISYGGNMVSRVDPLDPDRYVYWPTYQRLDLDDDEPGTWSIAYTYGAEPPALGQRAAIDLACELLKGVCGGECNEQVANVVRATRGGVTKELQNPTGEIRSLMPPSVRMFIEAYNPGDYRTNVRMRRPTVGSMAVTSNLGPTGMYGRYGLGIGGVGGGCAGCG